MQIELQLQTYKALVQLLKSDTDSLDDVIKRHVVNSHSAQKIATKFTGRPSDKQETLYKTGFWLFDQWFPCRTAKDIFVTVFRTFMELDDEFIDNFSREVIGRKRPYVARSRLELYPAHTKLQENAVAMLPGGWFIGTNESNKSKIKLMEEACRVSGLTVGEDFRIYL